MEVDVFLVLSIVYIVSLKVDALSVKLELICIRVSVVTSVLLVPSRQLVSANTAPYLTVYNVHLQTAAQLATNQQEQP